MGAFRKTLLFFGIFASLFLINSAFAKDKACELMKGGAGGTVCSDAAPTDLKITVKNVINTLLYAVGIASVIMIIYGGIMYVISAGDSGKITKAKSILIYAVVGLVISILSYAIVQFVVDNLIK